MPAWFPGEDLGLFGDAGCPDENTDKSILTRNKENEWETQTKMT